jgi:death-on-curing protein
MREPERLLGDVVQAVHERPLAEHGGRPGMRDRAGLASPLARPRNVFAYANQPKLVALAAAYACGIARNHPFIDGNKWTALVAALLFLRLNGFDVKRSIAP